MLVCDADRLSYADAARRSESVARGLLALGSGRGSHVGVLAPNGSTFVVATLAAARIGAVVVPIPTFATQRELSELLAAADVSVLVSVRSYRSHDYAARLGTILGARLDGVLVNVALPQLRHVVFDLAELCRLGEAVPAEMVGACEADVDESDPLVIVHTSGSTNAPKGAVHTHGALVAHQRNLNAIRRLGSSDRLFCNSPFFWIGGFGFGLLATLLAGATLICSNATDAEVTLDLLETERPTVTNGFAASVAHLARHPSFAGRDLSSMTRGNLYPIMPPEVRPADPALRHDMLGMTEAGGTFLLSDDDGDQPASRRGSYGTPAPGFETRITASGELCIRGPYVMQRYHGRSREECFDADGWFHTGDAVTVDGDGFFHYLGRRDGMIKTAGANVSPVEVARAIGRVTGSVSYVLGLPDAERGQVVGAVLVADDPDHVDVAALREALSRELSSYKVPRRIVASTPARIPLLSSGKVDVRRLPELFDG